MMPKVYVHKQEVMGFYGVFIEGRLLLKHNTREEAESSLRYLVQLLNSVRNRAIDDILKLRMNPAFYETGKNPENLLMKELAKDANQLEQWADESRSGGWSTHQVEPMRKRAKEIYELIGRMTTPGAQ